MKQGQSLEEMAKEIMRVSEAKKDYIAASSQIKMDIGDPSEDMARLMAAPVRTGGGLVDPEVVKPDMSPRLVIEGAGSFQIKDNTHGQIASRIKIPLAYYRRMMDEAPALLANNVNHWMSKDPARRMVRTLDGSARAFMSDRYRIIDNDEVLETVFPILSDLKVQIVSSAVTERKLYIKALFPKLEGEVKRGDAVQAGVVISNSETGAGSVQISPLLYRLICLNGAVMADASLKKYHVGRAADTVGSDAQRYFKDDTLIADDRAFMLKIRDVLMGAADETQFKLAVDKMRDASDRLIESVDLTPPVEVVKKRFNLSETERSGVLGYLQRGGDFSQFGMINAITRLSQDVEDYDRATELERVGGQLIEFSGREWSEIAKAA